MTITGDMRDAILKAPADAWTPAYGGDGQVRDGAWVADITGMPDLSSWPAGMRVIVRKERPHPGAQLRFTDIDGHRFTAFATNTRKGQLADLSAGPGPARSPLRSPACSPCRLADGPEPPQRHGRSHPGARGTPPTRRDSGAPSHGPRPRITTSRTPQASTSGTRKIEAKRGGRVPSVQREVALGRPVDMPVGFFRSVRKMAPAVTDGAGLLHIRLVSAALPENTVQHMLMFMESCAAVRGLTPRV